VELWPHARPEREKACDETPLDEAGIWKSHKISCLVDQLHNAVARN
jgi:hypothetical protein